MSGKFSTEVAARDLSYGFGQKRGIIVAPIIRIVPERDGGWLVITHRNHGWLHGDRQSALEDKAWLDAQWRGANK